MTTKQEVNLILHVLTGLIGIIAFYPVWTGLLRERLTPKSLKLGSFLGLVFLVISWLTAGSYYTTYYGQAVKAAVVAGKYPWAHKVLMEAKEHVFLFLPFLAAALFFSIWAFGDRLEREPGAKKSLAALTGLLVILGIIVTLAGVVVSGAVRVKGI